MTLGIIYLIRYFEEDIPLVSRFLTNETTMKEKAAISIKYFYFAGNGFLYKT